MRMDKAVGLLLHPQIGDLETCCETKCERVHCFHYGIHPMTEVCLTKVCGHCLGAEFSHLGG